MQYRGFCLDIWISGGAERVTHKKQQRTTPVLSIGCLFDYKKAWLHHRWSQAYFEFWIDFYMVNFFRFSGLSGFFVFENQNIVAAVESSVSNCPPDSWTRLFESLAEKIKTERSNALSVLMVRVSRFELEASWTPFKRDTKLRHTRIFCLPLSWRLRYITT